MQLLHRHGTTRPHLQPVVAHAGNATEDHAALTPAAATRELALPAPLALAATLAPLRHGAGDPSIRLDPASCWRATTTPEGPTTAHYRLQGTALTVDAWGPGAGWVLDRAPGLVGLDDDTSGFVPRHNVLRDLHRRLPGLRVPRTEAVAEALVPAVIEQKVTGIEAKRAWAYLVRRLGMPAPGPAGLVLPPTPDALVAAPSWVFHRAGVERRRAETICRVMARVGRLEEVTGMERSAAYRRLQAFSGVGPWTAALVAMVALGDADAIPVGDYHLPHQVSWALAGEPRGDDDRMLELLEPYRGHRARVVRLLVAGAVRAPRRGPRLAPRAIARH